MIKRTNLALGLGVALYFLPHVNSKLIFFPAVLISSLLPNLPRVFSGRRALLRNPKRLSFLGAILKSYITVMLLSILITFVYPALALPFFLGYSFTLSLDTFSKEGIKPFWPISNKVTNGHITAGGGIDVALFYVFVLFDIALLVKLFI